MAATEPRKVSASAGAGWLMNALGLYRRAPVALGLLGLIYAVIVIGVSLSAHVSVALFALLQLGLMLVAPAITGGMVLAAREVDNNHAPGPETLLAGFSDGRFPRLLATLLPQIAAVVLIAVLFVLLVGLTGMKAFAALGAAAQAGGQPDPALLGALPWGAMFLWFLLAVVIAIVTGFFTMLAVPEIMLRSTPAFAAMAASFRACTRNLPAIIVFFLLTLIGVIALQLAVMLIGVPIKLLLGNAAMEIAIQLITLTLLMPVMAAAIYSAWKDILGGATPPSLPNAAGGFEA